MCLMKSEEENVVTEDAECEEEFSRAASTTHLGNPAKNSLLDEVRKDKIGHIIIKHPESSRRRCKECSNHTVFVCKKCQVHLHSKCFDAFHEK